MCFTASCFGALQQGTPATAVLLPGVGAFVAAAPNQNNFFKILNNCMHSVRCGLIEGFPNLFTPWHHKHNEPVDRDALRKATDNLQNTERMIHFNFFCFLLFSNWFTINHYVNTVLNMKLTKNNLNNMVAQTFLGCTFF